MTLCLRLIGDCQKQAEGCACRSTMLCSPASVATMWIMINSDGDQDSWQGSAPAHQSQREAVTKTRSVRKHLKRNRAGEKGVQLHYLP